MLGWIHRLGLRGPAWVVGVPVPLKFEEFGHFRRTRVGEKKMGPGPRPDVCLANFAPTPREYGCDDQSLGLYIPLGAELRTHPSRRKAGYPAPSLSVLVISFELFPLFARSFSKRKEVGRPVEKQVWAVWFATPGKSNRGERIGKFVLRYYY
ncbi:unnamed protein product [Calypogeia fissa]